jgi:hypothetical protein
LVSFVFDRGLVTWWIEARRLAILPQVMADYQGTADT